jgi:hypothetical protein
MGTKIIPLHPSRETLRVVVLRSADTFREIVGAALVGLPYLQVCNFHTPKAAFSAICTRPPAMAIVDLDLLSESLLDSMESAAAVGVPIVCVSRNIERYERRLEMFPRLVAIDKPRSSRVMRYIVEGLLERPDTAPSPFLASDYIQLACTGRYSITIDIEGPRVSGSILIVEGMVWAASSETQRGIEALTELAFARDARVVCCSAHDPSQPRNLPEHPWEHLLLDAARRHDEQSHDAAVAGDESSGLLEVDFGTSSGPRGSSDSQHSTLAQFIEAAADALLQKKYRDALAAYERAAEFAPEDPIVRGNLLRLRELTTTQTHHHPTHTKEHEPHVES